MSSARCSNGNAWRQLSRTSAATAPYAAAVDRGDDVDVARGGVPLDGRGGRRDPDLGDVAEPDQAARRAGRRAGSGPGDAAAQLRRAPHDDLEDLLVLEQAADLEPGQQGGHRRRTSPGLTLNCCARPGRPRPAASAAAGRAARGVPQPVDAGQHLRHLVGLGVEHGAVLAVDPHRSSEPGPAAPTRCARRGRSSPRAAGRDSRRRRPAPRRPSRRSPRRASCAPRSRRSRRRRPGRTARPGRCAPRPGRHRAGPAARRRRGGDARHLRPCDARRASKLISRSGSRNVGISEIDSSGRVSTADQPRGRANITAVRARGTARGPGRRSGGVRARRPGRPPAARDAGSSDASAGRTSSATSIAEARPTR